MERHCYQNRKKDAFENYISHPVVPITPRSNDTQNLSPPSASHPQEGIAPDYRGAGNDDDLSLKCLWFMDGRRMSDEPEGETVEVKKVKHPSESASYVNERIKNRQMCQRDVELSGETHKRTYDSICNDTSSSPMQHQPSVKSSLVQSSKRRILSLEAMVISDTSLHRVESLLAPTQTDVEASVMRVQDMGTPDVDPDPSQSELQKNSTSFFAGRTASPVSPHLNNAEDNDVLQKPSSAVTTKDISNPVKVLGQEDEQQEFERKRRKYPTKKTWLSKQSKESSDEHCSDSLQGSAVNISNHTADTSQDFYSPISEMAIARSRSQTKRIEDPFDSLKQNKEAGLDIHFNDCVRFLARSIISPPLDGWTEVCSSLSSSPNVSTSPPASETLSLIEVPIHRSCVIPQLALDERHTKILELMEFYVSYFSPRLN